MKKPYVFFLAVTIFVFGSADAFSQKFPLKLGLKAAPNVGWMSPGTKGYSGDGARLGATIGVFGDFFFADNYALSAGLNFQFLDGKLHFPDTVPGHTCEVFRKYNLLYLEIPLMVKMKTKTFGKVAYFGQIGLGTGFRIKATSKDRKVLSDTGEAVESSDGFNEGTTLIRESVLIGVGIEYYVDDNSAVILGVSYSNSLNNVLNGTNNHLNRVEKSQLNFVELNLGFLF